MFVDGGRTGEIGLLGIALEKRFRMCPSDYFDGVGSKIGLL